jgi:hypothetical protein
MGRLALPKRKLLPEEAPRGIDGQEWLDREIAILRQLVEGEDPGRSRTRRRAAARSARRPRAAAVKPVRRNLARAPRVVDNALATAGSYITGSLRRPLRLVATAVSLVHWGVDGTRGRRGELAWFVIAAGLGVGVGVGVGVALALG